MENRLVTAIIALYISCFLYTQAFFVKVLTVLKGSDQLFWNHIAILVIFFVAIYFVLSKYISMNEDGGLMRVVRLFFLILSLLGLIISILYHIVPIAPLYHFPIILDKFFIPDQIFTIWLFVPIVILFF